MKKITIIIAVIVSLFISHTTPAKAAGNFLDAEVLSGLLVRNTTVYYKGAIDAQAIVNNTYQAVRLEFVLKPDFSLLALTVNGVNSTYGELLRGLPVPDTGYYNLVLDMSAYNGADVMLSRGTFRTNFLAHGANVLSKMIPVITPAFVPYEVGSSDPSSYVVTMTGVNNDFGWGYDVNRRGFVLQPFSPTTTDMTYTIANSRGKQIACGKFPIVPGPTGLPFVPEPVLLNISNLGGEKEVLLGDAGQVGLFNQQFDCAIKRNGVQIPAKVLYVSDANGLSRLQVTSSTLSGATIEVRTPRGDGTFNIVPTTKTTDAAGNITVVTTAYVNQAIVTVIPGPRNGGYNLSAFNITLTRAL